MPFNTNFPLKHAVGELLDLLHAMFKRKINATKYFTICCLDKNKNELTYASANNPLYIITETNGEKELTVYKADKQPCGFYHEPKPFTKHEYIWNKLQINNYIK